jgi:hypothetical protein
MDIKIDLIHFIFSSYRTHLNRLTEEVWIIFNVQTNSNEFGSLNYGIDSDYSLEK